LGFLRVDFFTANMEAEGEDELFNTLLGVKYAACAFSGLLGSTKTLREYLLWQRE